VSEENVQIVRQAVEAFNEGGIAASGAFMAHDMEFHEPPEQPAPRVARGRDEVREMWGEFESAWVEHRSELEEIRAVDDERVLLFTVEHFRGRDGMEVSAPWGALFTVRDDKIVRWQAFWDRRSALEAAGLRE
jgi:ketosteroid isomerase-like protein